MLTSSLLTVLLFLPFLPDVLGGRLLQSHIFKIGFNNGDTASQLSAKELEEHLLKIYTDRNKNERKYKLGQRENQSRK